MYHYPFLTAFNFIVHSVFFGFCLWSFFWVFRRRKEWRFYFSVDEIDKVIVKMVIVVTIVNLLVIAYTIFSEVFDAWYGGIEYQAYAFTNQMTGPYWLLFWTNTFIYYMLPFFFWFGKMKNLKWFRIIAVLLILAVLNFERIVILITSFHRDYLPSSWTMYGPDPFLIHVLYIVTFIALIAVILVIKKSRNNKPTIQN